MRSRLFFYSLTGLILLASSWKGEQEAAQELSRISDSITIFMCGDVMTGRGIDQVQRSRFITRW